MRTPLRILLMLFLITGLGQRAAPAVAETAAQPAGWGLEQLMRELGSVKLSTAHFTERRSMRMLKRPLQSNGILNYEAPGRLLKETLQPKPERLLVDRDTVTIEREGKTETLRSEDYPQVWAFIEGIRATLAGDLSALQRFYDAHLEGSPENWRLVLQPRDDKMREIVQSIRISGDGVHIKRIETQERNGDHTDTTIVEDTP